MASLVKQVTTAGTSTRSASPRTSPRRLGHYLGAALLSRTADEGSRVALVLLALDRTGSAAVGGTLVATLLIPHVVAAPLVGSLVDRSRRPGRVLAAAITIFAVGLIAAVILLGRSPLWLSYLLLAVAGCCGPAITGGLTSRLGGLVEPDQQARAFGLDSLFYNVAGVAGPAGVALTASVVGPGAATLILAGLAAFGALGVLTLRLTAAGESGDRRHPSDLLGGVRTILHDPPLRTLTLTSSLGQLGPGALAVVATVLAASTHHAEAGGLLLAAMAAGAFVGSLLWTWRPLPADWAPSVTGWSMIGVGVPLAAAALVTTAGDGSLPWTAALFAVSGLFIGPFAAALFLARNQLAPVAVRTQVFTIGAGLKVTASALGAALIGFAAQQPVSTQLLLVSASPLLAGVLAVVFFRRR